MRKIEVLEKMTFSDYYKSLEASDKKRIRSEFISRSGIEFPTFYTKLNSGKYSLLEQKLLEELCSTEFFWK